jgi:hypothetical protein
MNVLLAFWHLLNFFAAPFCVALLLLLLAKGLVWRQLLRRTSWGGLLVPMVVLGALGQALALWLFGAEGKVLGYALWLSFLSLPIAWCLLR